MFGKRPAQIVVSDPLAFINYYTLKVENISGQRSSVYTATITFLNGESLTIGRDYPLIMELFPHEKALITCKWPNAIRGEKVKNVKISDIKKYHNVY